MERFKVTLRKVLHEAGITGANKATEKNAYSVDQIVELVSDARHLHDAMVEGEAMEYYTCGCDHCECT